MAEEKEPERKKLSLQGNKKLSLGLTQEIRKNPRNSSSTGLRSVQVETRRKRFSKRDGLEKTISTSDSSNNKSWIYRSRQESWIVEKKYFFKN